MEDIHVRFSLILATLGREQEPKRFLENLDQQSYRNFELIVIDQNPNDAVLHILSEYENHFSIRWLHSKIGLSHARNIGLGCFSGDVVAFPDDDCWYPHDMLGKLASAFAENPSCDGFTGRIVDDLRAESYRWFPKESGWLNEKNVWRQGVSTAIFLRERVIHSVGRFDELLGAGSQQGRLSAEETEYLIRAMKRGHRIYYCSDLYIFHRDDRTAYDEKFIKKAFGYSVGMGHVLRVHDYPISFVLYGWFRALAGGIVSLLMGDLKKSHYHFAVLKGRILGWLGSN